LLHLGGIGGISVARQVAGEGVVRLGVLGPLLVVDDAGLPVQVPALRLWRGPALLDVSCRVLHDELGPRFEQPGNLELAA
jgi:hypothetical protein